MSKPSKYEVFCDAGYFDQWCVRPIGEKRFGAGFHLPSQAEAEGLREVLDAATSKIERLTVTLATARNDAVEEAAQAAIDVRGCARNLLAVIAAEVATHSKTPTFRRAVSDMRKSLEGGAK